MSLHLAIITGSGIVAMVTLSTILLMFHSASADGSLAIIMNKHEYGIGEPISFFVQIRDQAQDKAYPVAFIVNGQNQTVWYDNDLPPNGSKEGMSEYYVSENSENIPMINQTGEYSLFVTYGGQEEYEALTVTELVNEDGLIHFYGPYHGLESEIGTAQIANQSYYITTVYGAPSDQTRPNDTTIEFHDVSFTFPGCGMCPTVPMPFNPLQYVRVQFPDNTTETLAVRDNIWSTISMPVDFHEYFPNGTKIFPNGTRGTWHPILHRDQFVTTLTQHTEPQAGITVIHDSIKFLVSAQNTETITYNTSLQSNKIISPLQQVKLGIATKDVKCKSDLQLVIKAEDGSPACVSQQTKEQLLNRGWGVEGFARTEVTMSPKTNELEIDLANQTYEAGYPIDVNLKNVNQDYGCKIPSVTVREESSQSLVFGPTPERDYGHSHCTDPWDVTFYAGLENNSLVTQPTRYQIVATLDNKTYQKEFTAIPSQYSGKSITADSTQTLPGFLTFTSCLPIPNLPPNNGTLINYAGFDLYHRYLAGPGTEGIPEIDDYLLKLGHTGSFVMQIHQGQFSEGADLAGGLYFLSENLLNLDNSTVWNNRPLASEAHTGLILSYTPSFARAGPEGYATITASITALQNAPRGTYWLYLPPGICGGDRVLLTIGEQPLAQPPDYIGYDFASNFVQGFGNPNRSDVTFELINAGIHTFENCSLNYVSKNQTTTIKTINVIPPGMEYTYHANLTSISKINGFLECKKPPITKVYPDVGFDIIPY